jgi:hypothetical protein
MGSTVDLVIWFWCHSSFSLHRLQRLLLIINTIVAHGAGVSFSRALRFDGANCFDLEIYKLRAYATCFGHEK